MPFSQICIHASEHMNTSRNTSFRFWRHGITQNHSVRSPPSYCNWTWIECDFLMFSISTTKPCVKRKILHPVHGDWATWLSHTGIGAWASRSSNLLSSVFPASTSAQLAAKSEHWKPNGRETAGVRAKSYRIFKPLGISVPFHTSRMFAVSWERLLST